MTMPHRLRWAALLCAALLACVVGACKRADSGPVVLRFWAMGREGEVVKELLVDFERSHPGIRVDVQQLPWTAAQEKLLTAFAGDVSPDLCQLGNTWLPQFAALGALAPVGPRVDQPGGIEPGDYFPGIWDSNRIDDGLYGVPWYVDTRLIYYRKDLLAKAGFAKPPVDWAEWVRVLRALKRDSPANFGVLLPLNEYEPLLALGLQQEAPLLREGGRYGNFRSPEFRRTLAFYADMFANQWSPRSTNTQISNVWDEFANGYYSFYINGPWNMGEFKRRLPPEKQGIWMTAPPAIDAPGPSGPGSGASTS
jgi:multiple sugar transport system substrate-binding protein